jgi:DNA-binding winged helix-turn-helix (wHTH) protein
MSGRFYNFGPFQLDTEEQVLLRDGRPLSLKPKVFDLLLVLVGHVQSELSIRVLRTRFFLLK